MSTTNSQGDVTTPVVLPDGRHITVVQPSIALSHAQRWRQGPEFFKQYESLLRYIIGRWPQESQVSVPPGMSPNTFVNRFRDARLALMKYNYDPDLAAQFANVGTQMVFNLDVTTNTVHIVHRKATGRRGIPIPSADELATRKSDAPLHLPTLSQDELTAFCLLLAHGHIKGPIQSHGTYDPVALAKLEEAYNIAFTIDGDVLTLL